jgi:large subunit ribosomal protein L17
VRHLRKGKRLGRLRSARRALLRDLAEALLKRERIRTTDAKAKALRPYVERIITRARRGGLHDRRLVARDIRDGRVLKRLFAEIGPRYAARPGGYTRIVKVGGFRPGDAARISQIELV